MLINQLWSAIEALPEPEPQSDAKRPSKQDEVIAMLRRPEGATVDEVARATGWPRHWPAQAGEEAGARFVRPKNRGPDQCASVIRSAIAVSDR